MTSTPHSSRSSSLKSGTSILGLAILVAASASPAMAQGENSNLDGPYVGIGWGQFNLHIKNLDDAGTAVSSIRHSDDNAKKVFVGYRFNPYWALEAAYVKLGQPGDRFTATGSDGHYAVDISGFSPALIGTLPLGPVELFAKVGEYYYQSTVKVDFDNPGPRIESTHHRNDLLYGGGVGLTFASHLHVRAEYETVEIQNAKHSDAFWLSTAWRF